MENLPPISTLAFNLDDMYSSIRENRDFGVIKKYESGRVASSTKVSPTKKGSYLDDEIRMSCSPGPASTNHINWDKANSQPNWSHIKQL